MAGANMYILRALKGDAAQIKEFFEANIIFGENFNNYEQTAAAFELGEFWGVYLKHELLGAVCILRGDGGGFGAQVDVSLAAAGGGDGSSPRCESSEKSGERRCSGSSAENSRERGGAAGAKAFDTAERSNDGDLRRCESGEKSGERRGCGTGAKNYSERGGAAGAKAFDTTGRGNWGDSPRCESGGHSAHSDIDGGRFYYGGARNVVLAAEVLGLCGSYFYIKAIAAQKNAAYDGLFELLVAIAAGRARANALRLLAALPAAQAVRAPAFFAGGFKLYKLRPLHNLAVHLLFCYCPFCEQRYGEPQVFDLGEFYAISKLLESGYVGIGAYSGTACSVMLALPLADEQPE